MLLATSSTTAAGGGIARRVAARKALAAADDGLNMAGLGSRSARSEEQNLGMLQGVNHISLVW